MPELIKKRHRNCSKRLFSSFSSWSVRAWFEGLFEQFWGKETFRAGLGKETLRAGLRFRPGLRPVLGLFAPRLLESSLLLKTSLLLETSFCSKRLLVLGRNLTTFAGIWLFWPESDYFCRNLTFLPRNPTFLSGIWHSRPETDNFRRTRKETAARGAFSQLFFSGFDFELDLAVYPSMYLHVHHPVHPSGMHAVLRTLKVLTCARCAIRVPER